MFETVGRYRDPGRARRHVVACLVAAALTSAVVGAVMWSGTRTEPEIVALPWDPMMHLVEAEVDEASLQIPAPPAGGRGSGPARAKAAPRVQEVAEPPPLREERDDLQNPEEDLGDEGADPETEGTGIGTGGAAGAGSGRCVVPPCGEGDGVQEFDPSDLAIHQRGRLSYPREARRMKLDEVRCRATVLIDAEGVPERVSVHDGCHPLFRSAVRSGLLRWRWRAPRNAQGDPVRARTEFGVTFRQD